MIHVNHRCNDYHSYRAARVKSLFNAESGSGWSHVADLPIEGESWKIGLIVGPSGSGKTSLGSAIFQEGIHDLYAGWPTDVPIVDAIAPDGSFNDVTGALASVGLGDVPAWLRPFNVLSNGEKFRAGMARLMAERHEPVTAATWFWANDKLDGGDICQQEIVKIDYGLTPKEFYYRHMIPAMLRTLDRALIDLERGFKRAIKQVDEFSSYDSFLTR